MSHIVSTEVLPPFAGHVVPSSSSTIRVTQFDGVSTFGAVEEYVFVGDFLIVVDMQLTGDTFSNLFGGENIRINISAADAVSLLCPGFNGLIPNLVINRGFIDRLELERTGTQLRVAINGVAEYITVTDEPRKLDLIGKRRAETGGTESLWQGVCRSFSGLINHLLKTSSCAITR
ncbi:MAG: hypothetical protein ACPGPF_00020 [Pontibacterium sp.]